MQTDVHVMRHCCKRETKGVLLTDSIHKACTHSNFNLCMN